MRTETGNTTSVELKQIKQPTTIKQLGTISVRKVHCVQKVGEITCVSAKYFEYLTVNVLQHFSKKSTPEHSIK